MFKSLGRGMWEGCRRIDWRFVLSNRFMVGCGGGGWEPELKTEPKTGSNRAQNTANEIRVFVLSWFLNVIIRSFRRFQLFQNC